MKVRIENRYQNICQHLRITPAVQTDSNSHTIPDTTILTSPADQTARVPLEKLLGYLQSLKPSQLTSPRFWLRLYGFLQTLPLASNALAIWIIVPSVGVIPASLRRIGSPASLGQTKKTRQIALTGFLIGAWRCPTLAWGDPTLPSAIGHFTAEFGMGSGGSNLLWSPGLTVSGGTGFLLSGIRYSSLLLLHTLAYGCLSLNRFGVIWSSRTSH